MNIGIEAELTRDQIREALEAHERWLKSDGASGERAHLQNISSTELGVITGKYLRGINLAGSSFYLMSDDGRRDGIWFLDTNLENANLSGAHLIGAFINRTNLRGANLRGATLSGAQLALCDLREANLTDANLMSASFIGCDLRGADISKAKVYGISAWDLQTSGLVQDDLVITRGGPTVTADNIEVAQFLYVLLQNSKIRDIIDTIGRKSVLILGRFTPERKSVLDAIRERLRFLDYVPIMFDFDKPIDRDYTETLMTLAGMCRFIIADITNPKSSPLELQASVPNFMIPFVPIIQEGEEPFSMFADLYGKFDWVLEPLEYDSAENLVNHLEKGIIKRALDKHTELMLRKTSKPRIVKLQDL